jgi:integrase
MTSSNINNERAKRKYYEWLKEGRGFSVSTIDQIARSVSIWEDHIVHRDFRELKTDDIKAFKRKLQDKTNIVTGEPLSITTQHHHLLHLNDFYKWLSLQQGYKAKVRLADVAYFALDRKQTRMALDRPMRRFPTPEIIKKLIGSIVIENEIDRRDRALFAFAFISGMRIDAIVSLPLGCVDMDAMLIRQDPSLGVRTKFGKRIPTTIFDFDHDAVEIVKEWIVFLRSEKLFVDADPLFPSTKVEQEGPGSYSFSATKLDRVFWKDTGPARQIFKKRFAAAGLDYYSPHSFRRAAVNTALSLCKTPSDFKAVSQNLGHEKIATTMFDYANLPEDEVAKHVKQITQKEPEGSEDIVKKILKDYDIRPKN